MMTLCGKVLHQWYVRCDARKGFEPRNLIARISCGGDGKCEKSLTWEPESGPKAHSDSVKRWTEIDPDREGVGLPDLFYPFMKLWIIEGPPREEPPLVGHNPNEYQYHEEKHRLCHVARILICGRFTGLHEDKLRHKMWACKKQNPSPLSAPHFQEPEMRWWRIHYAN